MEATMHLDHPLTEAQRDYLLDVDFDHTSEVYFRTKHGKEVHFVKKLEPSEWLEDSDPGQEYGSTWACRQCGRSLHENYVWNPYRMKWLYCPWCGRNME